MVTVAHVGILGDYPGGMAQVVNEYLTWRLEGVNLRGILSARRRHDPLSPVLACISALRLLSLIFTNGPRVAVFHLSEGGSFVREGGLLLFTAALKIPCIAHIHGARFVQFAERRPHLARAVLGRADRILVLSEESWGAVSNLGFSATRVRNPVRVPSLQPDPAEKIPVAVFCGEVSLRKGADVLVRAWGSLGPEANGWRLVLAGPPSMDLEIPETSGSIEMLGAIRHDEALEWCRRSAIAVLPSRDEALPMFILESMARGCAIIATPVGQVTGVLAAGAGMLVPVGDEVALAAALREMMHDDELRRRFAAAAYLCAAETFSSEAVGAELNAIWRETAKERGGA